MVGFVRGMVVKFVCFFVLVLFRLGLKGIFYL